MRGMMKWASMASLLLLVGCATTQPQAPQVKRISPEELERIMPKPVPNLTLDEIVQLSKAGTPPEQIIEKIKATNSFYDLTPSQSLELSKKGVDAKVLDHIYKSHEQVLRDSVAEEINKRERQRVEEKEKLKREYQMRSYQYYDPWWGYAPGPYWRHRPFYGPSFRYHWGW